MIPSEEKKEELDNLAAREEVVVSGEQAEPYDLQELHALHQERWHTFVVHRRHIGLSWHNKRALRQTFKAELLPEAEFRRALFKQMLNLSNLLYFLFANQPKRSWLLYALS